MIENNGDTGGLTRESHRQVPGATSIGLTVFKPIMHFQVSLLRMWAHNVERFAANYEKGFEETATAVERPLDTQRAA